MNVRFFVKVIGVVGISMLFTACNMFGGGGASQQKSNPDQSKPKAQSTTGRESVIDQELKKQLDMYKEIIQHQKEQEQKVIQQSEERYKILKEQSDKPAKTEKGGTSSSKPKKGTGSDKTSKTGGQGAK
jgi:hypothetical protein